MEFAVLMGLTVFFTAEVMICAHNVGEFVRDRRASNAVAAVFACLVALYLIGFCVVALMEAVQ